MKNHVFVHLRLKDETEKTKESTKINLATATDYESTSSTDIALTIQFPDYRPDY